MSGPGMESRLADGEVLREARRVLRKLAVDGATLEPAGEGFALMGPGRGGVRRPTMRVPTGIVAAFYKRDWLKTAESGGYIISDAGIGWLRRVLAEEDPFASQHRIVTKRAVAGPDGIERMLHVNDGESPLGWLYRRRGADGKTLITKTQWEAGERLRADFTRAQMTPRMGVDLTAPVVAGRRGAKDAPLAESVVAAKQRFSRALDAVGTGLADLLVDVCCHLVGLEAAERQLGWPQRSAKVVLGIALDRLAQHYGLGEITGTGSRLRAWAMQDDEGTRAP